MRRAGRGGSTVRSSARKKETVPGSEEASGSSSEGWGGLVMLRGSFRHGESIGDGRRRENHREQGSSGGGGNGGVYGLLSVKMERGGGKWGWCVLKEQRGGR